MKVAIIRKVAGAKVDVFTIAPDGPPRKFRPGGNKGRWHGASQGKAKGSKTTNAKGHKLSPRQSASYNAVDLAQAAELAHKAGVPISEILRRALWAYVVPFTQRKYDGAGND